MQLNDSSVDDDVYILVLNFSKIMILLKKYNYKRTQKENDNTEYLEKNKIFKKISIKDYS